MNAPLRGQSYSELRGSSTKMHHKMAMKMIFKGKTLRLFLKIDEVLVQYGTGVKVLNPVNVVPLDQEAWKLVHLHPSRQFLKISVSLIRVVLLWG